MLLRGVAFRSSRSEPFGEAFLQEALSHLLVNDVAGVPDAPWWMKHFHPSTANGMTFVDLVFPAFLFIVGMSIPLAVRARTARGEAPVKLTLHALLRVATLLVLGLFMVNMEQRDHATWWAGLFPTLVYASAILACVRWPRMNLVLRGIGALGLAALAWAYHPAKGGWSIAGGGSSGSSAGRTSSGSWST